MILVVGVFTCMMGIILVLRHLHVWRLKTDTCQDDKERSFLFKQLRRRTLTSTCIAVLGFVIVLLHFRDYWLGRPLGYTILICCSLVLVLMIFVLACFDMLAVSHAVRLQEGKTGEAAQELAREYHRMKEKQASEKPDLPPESPE